eukprot:gnl/Chilomastix_caulleri/607.p1 GENE.gnl/Chilomastix_caulleri/607~~gnl/Chilomastix_caulleri/607.p1  ORF type:complete len:196 (+),score=30.78 gnl/Chilomastix_caulleri/607:90-677(+)
MLQEFDHLYKLIIIGDSGVGKSCLLLRFSEDSYIETHISTIGVDFKIKTLEVGGKTVKLQMWDTAGQERFKNICSSYYRGADGVFVVFDITNPVSFQNVANWLKEADKHGGADSVRFLIGNKSDLESARQVSREQAMALANQQGMVYMETSAKLDNGVGEAFAAVASKMMEKAPEPEVKEQTFNPEESRKSGGCC